MSHVVENFNSINKRGLDFSWIGVKNYRIFYDLMGRNEPFSGILAICMLLQHNPAELLITGYSFYNQGKTLEKAYLPNFGLYDKEVVSRNRTGGHIVKPQIEFFKHFIVGMHKKIIVIDNYLNNLLNLNYNKILDDEE
jgi:hypothetical protein